MVKEYLMDRYYILEDVIHGAQCYGMMYIEDKCHRIMMQVVERRYKEDSKQMRPIQRTWNVQNSVIQCFNCCILTRLNNFSSRGKILCLTNTKLRRVDTILNVESHIYINTRWGV